MKNLLIVGAILFVLYYLYEHFTIVISSDSPSITEAVKRISGQPLLPVELNIKDLVSQTSAPNLLLRVSVAIK